MIEVPVYLPRGDQSLIARTVAPRSAIVGSEPRDGAVVVYYEGNLYGAMNMDTYTDRAMFAYWRMRDHYPTVAMAVVPESNVERAGTLYPEHGRIDVSDAEQLARVARWLDIDLAELGASQRLAAQLQVEGVRV